MTILKALAAGLCLNGRPAPAAAEESRFPVIYLAYNGSTNGDWIARYGITLALNDPDRRLKVIHVDTGEIPRARLDGKLAFLARECAAAGLALDVAVVPPAGDVFRTLVEHVPAGTDTYLVCGARAMSGYRGYLAGTTTERLLGRHRVNVMAVRVVQPGLLGAPHDFLLPVGGHPFGVHTGIAFMRLFEAGVRRVELLRVMTVGRPLFKRLGPEAARRLRETGRAQLRRVEDELVQRTGIDHARIDAAVVVSDDRKREILIAASRHRSHLICMEASLEHLGTGFFYGNPLEVILRDASCDVAIYRGAS